MNEKVFWSIFAALVLGWIAGYFLWVSPTATEAAEQEASVGRKVRAIERLSKLAPEQVPTSALVEQEKARDSAVEESLRSMAGVYEGRDALYQAYFPGMPEPTKGKWEAAYRDAYNQLAADYRAHAELPPEEKLPFRMMEIGEKIPLADYQKLWRIQETVVRATMRHDGLVYRYDGKPSGKAADAKAAAKEMFARIQVELEAALPPGRVNGFLAELETDQAVTFEIVTLDIGKQRAMLKLDVVEKKQEGEPPAAKEEPRVRVALELHALDWIGEVK